MKLFSAVLLIVLATTYTASAEPAIPNFWDSNEQMATPNADRFSRVRFLTTIDFPPFNYIDDSGRLAGFHVDLSRAICSELDLVDRCQIQALPWEELETALISGQGDAVLAGISVSTKRRESLLFSRSYMRFPARFVTPVEQDFAGPIHAAVSGRRIGVLAGSAHEAMLRDYFPAANPVTYSRAGWMYSDIKAGKIEAVFGDGMQLSFWLGSAGSGSCCKFSGGPYVSDKYFGPGLAIVTAGDNQPLFEALNFALRELQSRGTYAELYLRYFPISFY